MSVYNTTFDEESGNQLPNETMCPECEGQIRADGGERACQECGLIVEERRIDHGPEWRTFEEDTESKSRVGAPRTPTRHDRGLSTNIGYGRDRGGRNLSAAKRRRLTRQRREHNRAQFDSKQERNEMYGLEEIRRLYGALELPRSMWERGCELFRAAQEKDLFVGRSLDAFAPASLYAACRCAGLPHQIEEFAEHARCSLQAIRNAYAAMRMELDLALELRSPSDYVPKLISAGGLSPTAGRLARTLVDRVETMEVQRGAKPSGVAAACVYIASQEADAEPVTQKRIGEAAHVSTATIRTQRDTIREAIDVVTLGE